MLPAGPHRASAGPPRPAHCPAPLSQDTADPREADGRPYCHPHPPNPALRHRSHQSAPVARQWRHRPHGRAQAAIADSNLSAWPAFHGTAAANVRPRGASVRLTPIHTAHRGLPAHRRRRDSRCGSVPPRYHQAETRRQVAEPAVPSAHRHAVLPHQSCEAFPARHRRNQASRATHIRAGRYPECRHEGQIHRSREPYPCEDSPAPTGIRQDGPGLRHHPDTMSATCRQNSQVAAHAASTH